MILRGKVMQGEEARPGGMGRGILRFMEKDIMTSRLCRRHSPRGWGRCRLGSFRKGTGSRRVQGRKAKNKNHGYRHQSEAIWHPVTATPLCFIGQTLKRALGLYYSSFAFYNQTLLCLLER